MARGMATQIVVFAAGAQTSLCCRLRPLVKTQKHKLRHSRIGKKQSRVIYTALAFSLLNPHAILDMAVIFGGVAAGLESDLRLPFAAGGAAASFVWFFAIGYGAGKLSPYLKRAAVWRVVNCSVAVLMFAVAFALGADLLTGPGADLLK